MARFVVDCGVVLRLAGDELAVAPGHALLAPTLLRSQALATVHERAHRGELAPEAGRDLLRRVDALKIRLLGDGVLRRRAWELADRLGWADTYTAEYLALTQLQADYFVTLDLELAKQVEGVVATAPIDALRQS